MNAEVWMEYDDATAERRVVVRLIDEYYWLGVEEARALAAALRVAIDQAERWMTEGAG